MSRQYKVIDFDEAIFSHLYSRVLSGGTNPKANGAAFIISIEAAAAFYRHAVKAGAPTAIDVCSDVVFYYRGLPVRVRASLQPPESVGLFPPDGIAEYDRSYPPPFRGRRYRWH